MLGPVMNACIRMTTNMMTLSWKILRMMMMLDVSLGRNKWVSKHMIMMMIMMVIMMTIMMTMMLMMMCVWEETSGLASSHAPCRLPQQEGTHQPSTSSPSFFDITIIIFQRYYRHCRHHQLSLYFNIFVIFFVLITFNIRLRTVPYM